MTGPAYHGRTHIPGGTDPIAGLVDFIDDAVGGASTTGLPVCYASATAFSLVANNVWQQPTWTNFWTNNATVFEQSVSVPTEIHFAAGHYLVAYEVYMATPPTSPDYFAVTPSVLAYEDFPAHTYAGHGFVGDFSKVNNLTMAATSPAEGGNGNGWYRWQEFQVFPNVVFNVPQDSAGFFNLRMVKPSGSNVTIDDVRIYVVRISGAGDVGTAGDTGIFFDIDNAGDWLEVRTTGPSAMGDIIVGADTYTDPGIALVDGGGEDIVIASDGGALYEDVGSGSIFFQGFTGGEMFANMSGGYFFNSGFFQYQGDGFEVDSDQGVTVNSGSLQGININLGGGSSAGTFALSINGVSAFEIRPDGTVHIRSGGTIHADL